MKHNFFSKGHDGCIVHPAIMPDQEQSIHYVTKIGTHKTMTNEKQIYDLLPDEFVDKIYYKECVIDTFVLDETILDDDVINRIKEKGSKNEIYDTQITVKLFNGKNLAMLLDNSDINKIQVYKLLHKLIMFYGCIKKLNSIYHIYHRDITRHNILYDVTNNNICLVDFVQSKKYSHNKKPTHLPNKDLEDTMDVIKSVLDFIKHKTRVNYMPHITNIKQLIHEMNKIKYILRL